MTNTYVQNILNILQNVDIDEDYKNEIIMNLELIDCDFMQMMDEKVLANNKAIRLSKSSSNMISEYNEAMDDMLKNINSKNI